MQIKKLIYILLTVNINILYSLGEMSIIKYFEKHPDKQLTCNVNSALHDPILTDNYSCRISYKNSIYTITLSLKGEDKKIELENIGTSQVPLLKIINQDEFTSLYFNGQRKIFVDENPVVFERKPYGISLYFVYSQGLTAETDKIFHNIIEISSVTNKELGNLEDKYTLICYFPRAELVFEKSVISHNNAVVSTKAEIDEIYKKSLERFHWNNFLLGSSTRALSLSYAIKNIFPDKQQPILIELKGYQGNVFYFNGISTSLIVHYALGYVNHKKLYILDPLIIDDVIPGVRQWLKFFEGKLFDIRECIINTY